MRVFCTSERHANGGPGEFILARAEDALETLLSQYREQVQLIYLELASVDIDQLELPVPRLDTLAKFDPRLADIVGSLVL